MNERIKNSVKQLLITNDVTTSDNEKIEQITDRLLDMHGNEMYHVFETANSETGNYIEQDYIELQIAIGNMIEGIIIE